jgi:hypothetical protein
LTALKKLCFNSNLLLKNTNNVTSLMDKDVVERFCTKHSEKIKNYINKLNKQMPIPDVCLFGADNPNDNSTTLNSDLLNKSYVNTNSKTALTDDLKGALKQILIVFCYITKRPIQKV